MLINGGYDWSSAKRIIGANCWIGPRQFNSIQFKCKKVKCKILDDKYNNTDFYDVVGDNYE